MNRPDLDGVTALMYTAEHCNKACVAALIKQEQM